MQVTRGESSGPVPVLRLEGDFDAFEADDLRKELGLMMSEQEPSVILDLGDMTFANSTTIACFISAQNRAKELGGRIALAAPREFFRKTLTTLGLERVFSIHDDVASAEADLAARRNHRGRTRTRVGPRHCRPARCSASTRPGWYRRS